MEQKLDSTCIKFGAAEVKHGKTHIAQIDQQPKWSEENNIVPTACWVMSLRFFLHTFKTHFNTFKTYFKFPHTKKESFFVCFCFLFLSSLTAGSVNLTQISIKSVRIQSLILV